MRMLIEAGTDLTLRDREGLTPLGYARRIHRGKLLEQEAHQAISAASGHQSTPEEEQARADLMRKMLKEDFPNADPDRWNDLTLAEAVINLVEAAGGTD
jgi:hypothetical protein